MLLLAGRAMAPADADVVGMAKGGSCEFVLVRSWWLEGREPHQAPGCSPQLYRGDRQAPRVSFQPPHSWRVWQGGVSSRHQILCTLLHKVPDCNPALRLFGLSTWYIEYCQRFRG